MVALRNAHKFLDDKKHNLVPTTSDGHPLILTQIPDDDAADITPRTVLDDHNECETPANPTNFFADVDRNEEKNRFNVPTHDVV